MSALLYWVWLTALPGLTDRSAALLLRQFGTPEEIYRASQEALTSVPGLPPIQAAKLGDRSLERAETILEECAKKDIFIVALTDAIYPRRLSRSTAPAPALLYGRGRMPLFDDEAAVAVVGSRKTTERGAERAEALGRRLGSGGALVVSGMARGIDSAALRGALDAGGVTCAVLGNGVDIPYPEENRGLYEEILQRGAILSAYPPGTKPQRWQFPERNRIISGLSVCTVVAEAATERSGALITAQAALDQGRDVFWLSGGVSAPVAETLRLRGASAVDDGDALLYRYEDRFPRRLGRSGQTGSTPERPEPRAPEEKPPPIIPEDLPEPQRRVLACLAEQGPLSADDAAEFLELPVAQVLSALTMLEIGGSVYRTTDRRFACGHRLS